MCGIIAYFGKKNVAPILIDGLKKLEYRGYDSAGVCLLNNGKLQSAKVKGRVSELEKLALGLNPANKIGRAHV